MNKNVNPLIKWWVTSKLPEVHYADKVGFLKKWIANPVKRRLARWYLLLLQKITKIKVIGITGSAGKTTTKEMLASILKLQGKTIYSPKNIDPIYNIPNIILKTIPGTKYLILEMGVEYPNEMDFYLWLAKPDVGVITNIYPTHLEFLGSEDGVLAEKSKLVLSLDKEDVAILNSGDKKLKGIAGKIKSKIKWFNSDENQIIEDGFAASATSEALEISNDKISEGLKNYERPKHRLNLLKLKSGAVVLDDSYNSNPIALLSSLKYFIQNAGNNNKIAVLGDMKELGKFDEKLHRGVGMVVAKNNFQVLIGVGDSVKYLIDEVNKHSTYTKTYYAKDADDAISLLKPYLLKNNYVFVKGSRSIGLDKLVDAIS